MLQRPVDGETAVRIWAAAHADPQAAVLGEDAARALARLAGASPARAGPPGNHRRLGAR